ncbi:hypothetical protein HGM15179_017960 [Zosterops borbonicus]|uniref:Uncharacterized protein n=1 Tax=Zosterops borbonicus TaxID=364589 RepID=A0A8K1FZX1_9PASS|nr:hypothetical protein HGM15179_017960 [Zosterops borbonicus]
MPADSKMDLLLVKAKPIGSDGSTSEIAYLRREKNHCTTAAGGEMGENMERTNSADTKVSEEGVGGGAPGAGAEIPQQPVEVYGGTEIHLQLMQDPMLEQFYLVVPDLVLSQMEVPLAVSFLQLFLLASLKTLTSGWFVPQSTTDVWVNPSSASTAPSDTVNQVFMLAAPANGEDPEGVIQSEKDDNLEVTLPPERYWSISSEEWYIDQQWDKDLYFESEYPSPQMQFTSF